VTAPANLLRTTSFRLFLAYLLLFATAAGAIAWAVSWRTSELLTSRVLQVIAAEVRGLREQYQIGGLPLLVDVVQERSRVRGSSLYLLTDASGRRLAGNLDRMPAAMGAVLAGGSQGGPFRYAAVTEPTRERHGVGVPIQVAGGALLLVARDVEDERAYAATTRQIFLLGFGLVSLLGLGGALWMSRRLLGRVDDVTAASRRIMAGDLSGRLPLAGTGDELDRLSAGLNEMLARIEQLMSSLREVSDNIAHDLKTPLTRLRNRAEAALRDPVGAAAHRAGLEHAIEEADEIIKTFNALLAIARMEAGAASERLEVLDLASVVGELAELYLPAAEEAGFAVSFRGTPDIRVRADRQLVGQAVANLIENAIKYTGDEAGGADTSRSIAVEVKRDGSEARIVVSDRGPGIPAHERERVLRRFVRLEASRTRPGTGLGLSLVAAVARLHGGVVRLEDNAPGLRVVLAMPAAGGVEAVAGAVVDRASDEAGREGAQALAPRSVAG
jgi:signal transduction histidine kinase